MIKLPDPAQTFVHEEGFWLTCKATRLAKVLALYEAYKLIAGVPGAVVECGVFKGSSFCILGMLRSLLENPWMRPLVGFDTFTSFADATNTVDATIRDQIRQTAGLDCISREQLTQCLSLKGGGVAENVHLIEGDICHTVPRYVAEEPSMRISLLSVDVDFDKATETIIEHLFPRVVLGGVVLFDDYGTFLGETTVVDRFLMKNEYRLRQFSFTRHPCYIVKGERNGSV